MSATSHYGLPKDWVLVPALDVEFKQYTLLAYLQKIEQRFNEKKVFPYLTDVDDHLADLILLRSQKAELKEVLNGELTGFDPKTGLPIYTQKKQADLLQVIDDVVEFAIPGLEKLRMNGLDLVDHLNGSIHVSTIGVQPLHASDGWIFIRTGTAARVYGYSLPMVHTADPPIGHNAMRTKYITTYPLSIGSHYHHIKEDLVQRYRDLPTPATFAIECEIALPYVETLVPIAKQLVYRSIRTE